MAKAKETYTPATTPEDNNYCPQRGSFDPCYSGHLDNQDTEYETRDAQLEATRKEFGKAIPAGTGPGVTPGHDLD